MLVQCYWLTLFCSVKTYNCSTSPLVYLLSFFSSQWTSLWWHTHQRGILNTPPLSLYLVHSVHLVSLFWLPQFRMWWEGLLVLLMPDASVLPRLLSASESQRAREGRSQRGKWTSDPNCHPSSSKHWMQSLHTIPSARDSEWHCC